jgi:hypothetical protein
VVKSHEVNTWFIIAGGTIVLFAFAGIIANSHRLPTGGRDLMAFAALLGTRVFGILAAPILVLMLAAMARHSDPAPLGLVGGIAAPRALEDLGHIGGQADVLQTGPRQLRRRAC